MFNEVSPWCFNNSDIIIQGVIFKDMIREVLDRFNRVRLVCTLFNDARPLGKVILGKLLNVIDYHTEGRELPSFNGTTN